MEQLTKLLQEKKKKEKRQNTQSLYNDNRKIKVRKKNKSGSCIYCNRID